MSEILSGSAEFEGVKTGAAVPVYVPRQYDVQILNSLIIFCALCFAVRIAQRFLMIFSINI